jgi:hypothetical protein
MKQGSTIKTGEIPTEERLPGAKGRSDNQPNDLMRSPDFEKIYATKAIPFMTDFDFRIVLTNEVMKTETGWCTIADQMVILTPVAAKELVNELGACISAYEEMLGKIKPRNKNRIITTFERGER